MTTIQKRMGEIFAEIMAFMSKNGIAPYDAPFAYWHNMNSESVSEGMFDMECGYPVAIPVEGEGLIKASKLPGGEIANAIHIGPYETLPETYNKIRSWIEENGYEADDDMWETYLTNPNEVPDESEWMIEISWPLK